MRVLAALLAVTACSIPDDRFRAIDASMGDVAPRADADLDGSDAPVDAESDAAVTCTQGTRRCVGNTVEECQAAAWMPVQNCDNVCSSGGCATPPSCNGGVTTCGAGADTCCRSLPVPAGMFARSYDAVTSGFTDDRYKATLTAFQLDKYEVSVARFQKFVNAYPASKPPVGSGANPRDATDPGWRTEWTAQLPATKVDLESSLLCDGLTSQTQNVSVRCVSWYVAQAFCIWDQGRLPTEAEWNFAASGGDQQRVYPWSVPATSNAISGTNAVYGGGASPSVPGSHSQGDGRWTHSDLAGNLLEWVFDNYATPYPTDTCNDCANHSAATNRAVRGGSYASVAGAVITSLRAGFPATGRDDTLGFRCARDPLP